MDKEYIEEYYDELIADQKRSEAMCKDCACRDMCKERCAESKWAGRDVNATLQGYAVSAI